MAAYRMGATVLQAIQGDITTIAVDVIVNAANSSLLGGGGVDGAIHRAGGPAILEACRMIRARQGSCAPGEAVITTAGELPAAHVIHTVGPVWNGGAGGEAETLRSCYLRSLELAAVHEARSMAFPNISTGIYRFPKALAAETAVQAVRDYLRGNSHTTSLREILFVCFDAENLELYHRILSENTQE